MINITVRTQPDEMADGSGLSAQTSEILPYLQGKNMYLSAYLLIFALELSDNYDTINTIVIVCSMRVGFGPLLIVVKVL